MTTDEIETIKLAIERVRIEPRDRRLNGEWKLEEPTPIDYWQEASNHLSELIAEEIDRMILEELFDEVEEQKELVESIIPKKLFEV